MKYKALVLLLLLLPTVYAYDYRASVADRTTGDRNAPVVIEEFMDLECPFCARFHRDTFEKIERNYINKGDVRYVVHHFPLSFHKQAMRSAVAAECAAQEGKFYEFIEVVFNNQDDLDDEDLIDYAHVVGVDEYDFEDCLERGYESNVKRDITLGTDKGVTGTPAFFVNGELVSGAQPYNVFEQLINKELGRKTPVHTAPKPRRECIDDSTLVEYCSDGRKVESCKCVNGEWECKDRCSKVNVKNVVLLVDVSGSSNANQLRLDIVKHTTTVANNLPSNVNIALVSFSSTAKLERGLRPMSFDLIDDINTLEFDGGTVLAAGLERAIEVVENEEDPHIILVSDGVTQRASDAMVLADAAGRRNIPVHVVARGRRTNEFVLKNVANRTGGEFVTSALDLTIFDRAVVQVHDPEPEIEPTETIEVVPTAPKEPVVAPVVMPGCERDGKLLPLGERLLVKDKPLYCGSRGLARQKVLGNPCQNNYECETNSCSSGSCVDLVGELEETKSLMESILSWFTSVFGQ